MLSKRDLYALLDGRGTVYEAVEHPAVSTMEELDALDLPGADRVLKNLFLRDDKKRNWYLVSLPGHGTLDLKVLRRRLQSRPLSLAGAGDLERLLHVKPGHVTPLAALNDDARAVTVVLDAALEGRTVGVHPMENTATDFLYLEDVAALVREHGIPVVLCDLRGE